MAFAALVVASFAAALVVVDFVIPVEVVVAREVAVVLVALRSVVVQVSSACLTNKQARWFYINQKIITWRLHPCIAVASSILNRLINFHRFGMRGASLLNALFHPST